MTAPIDRLSDNDVHAIDHLRETFARLKSELGRVIVGQHDTIERLAICLFARGHALLMGVPGLAKTLLVSKLSETMSLNFSRIQFTPDLMPMDITGTDILQDTPEGRREFHFVHGPVFANIVLADEINRAPPKTQAAMLEAMQEYKVTVLGKTFKLDPPFLVLATQNPVEQEGTYPLPEAQLDRFMFLIELDYPNEEEEIQIARTTTGEALPELTASHSGFVLGEDTNSLSALATLTTTATASSDVGSYPITASGASGSNYVFSYAAGTLTITQALTTGTIASSANPAILGSNVTFTVTVSAVPPGAGTTTGTVDFRIDGANAGSATLSGGIASFSISTLETGTHTVAAEFAGNLNFVGVTNLLTPDQVINEPPSEGGDLIERYPLQGVKVRVATLEANDPHPNNDPFRLASVSETSVAGATITMHDGWVFYEPPPGFTNADSFTYAATNSGGASVTMSVTVNPRADFAPPENLRAVHALGNGNRSAEFQGIPGRTYTIQYTENLNAPDWQTLGTSQADATGWFEFVDTPPTNSPARFYRSTYP